MHKDGLYVDWHLLAGLNHNCSYSHEPPEAATEQFYCEPLMRAAYELLTLNRPEYIFHLYGGEPSIHPYFLELFKYLATSARNTRILLDTNGLRKPDYYAKLLKDSIPESVCVTIDAHLKYMEPRKSIFENF